MSNYGTFGENNPVWKAISRFADMMVTGIIFIITCLPIITIGASLCAFYYAAMDSMRKEDGYIFRRYFRGFGKNFKKATLIWLVMLAIGAVFAMDVWFWMSYSDSTLSLVMFIISLILSVAWLMTLLFVFPLQTRFENTIWKTIQNAFLLAVGRLPVTIAIIVLLGIVIYICSRSWLAVLLMLLFGTGVIGYLLVYNFERMFKKCGYIDEDDGRIKNDDYEFDVEVDYEALHKQNEEEQDSPDV